MIEIVRQGLKAHGHEVSLSKVCRWFDVPRRTVYYRSTKAAPKVQEHFAAPIKAMIEENPSFGYRTVAGLLGFNKNTVRRIFQIMNWQVRKHPIGFRPRVEASPSKAETPNERWATDLCRIWTGRDGWAVLALVIDCFTRERLGWHLSRSGKAKTAEAALEEGLIARFGTLGRVPNSFLLRSDIGLVFASHTYSALVRGYGLQQEFITPHTPEQKGRVERAIGFARDAFFAGRTFRDLDDLNDQATAWCEGVAADRPCPEDRTRSVRELWIEEKPHLLTLPENPFPSEQRLEVQIQKTPCARFDLNDYSVPHTHVRRTVIVLASQHLSAHRS